MQLKIGTFTSPTATGNQAVTGIGFQPDLVIFMAHENPSEGRIGSIRYFFGAAKSSTEQWVNAIFSPDGAAAAADKHYASASYCIFAQDGGSSVGYRAALVSMDSDGFTVNWDDVATSGRLVGYCAIKGAGQLQLKLGSFDINSTTGDQAITGVGFSPDAVLFCLALANTTTETINPDSTFCMGFATSSVDRFCGACGGNDAADPTQEDTFQMTNRCLLRMEPGNVPAINNLLDFVSMDSDGFTVNVGTASGTPRAYYLAMGGCSAKASFIDLNTTTGNQSKTGIGFQPELNLFASDCKPDHGVNSNPTCKHMIGVGVSSTQRMVVDGCAHDGFSTTSADTFFKTTQCIESPDAFNNNNDCQADFVSNDSDGFTVNNNLVDADSRRILSLSIKEDAAPAGGHPMYSRRKDQKFLRQSPALLAA